jgi:hypothetical protein
VQVLSQMRSESSLAVAAMHQTNASAGRISSFSQHLLSVHVLRNTVLVQEEAGEGDYSSAASVYQSYCRGAGFTAEPAHATTTTFDPNVPTVTQATFVTQTSASPSPGSASFGS